MHTFLIAIALLATTTVAAATPPWETRVDLPVPIPVELPAIPETNPFAQRLDTSPVLQAAPLRERFDITLSLEAAAYIDPGGRLRRAVPLRVPLPGVEADIVSTLLDTSFNPAQTANRDTATWLTLGVDLTGRINSGRTVRVEAHSPMSDQLPAVASVLVPVATAEDLALPATPVDQLDRAPTPRRFRARLTSRKVRQTLRVLTEVDEDGRPQRAVFLECAEGLRPWLLESMAAWRFLPATRRGAAVTAWAQVEGELEVDLGTFTTESLRVIRQRTYPSTP